jgi:hypothetical protein
MNKSPRRVAAESLKFFASTVRGSSYYVKRGAINWANFDFEAHPRAISILFDEQSLLKEINDCRVSLEMFSRLPEVETGIDDGLMDELFEDAEYIFRSFVNALDGQGNSVVLSADQPGVRVVEAHDANLGVQGVVVMMNITY